jgi:hypothetical protein
MGVQGKNDAKIFVLHVYIHGNIESPKRTGNIQIGYPSLWQPLAGRSKKQNGDKSDLENLR